MLKLTLIISQTSFVASLYIITQSILLKFL